MEFDVLSSISNEFYYEKINKLLTDYFNYNQILHLNLIEDYYKY